MTLFGFKLAWIDDGRFEALENRQHELEKEIEDVVEDFEKTVIRNKPMEQREERLRKVEENES